MRFTLKKTVISALAWLLTCAGSSEARDIGIALLGPDHCRDAVCVGREKRVFQGA